jgi:hypothetical protein
MKYKVKISGYPAYKLNNQTTPPTLLGTNNYPALNSIVEGGAAFNLTYLTALGTTKTATFVQLSDGLYPMSRLTLLPTPPNKKRTLSSAEGDPATPSASTTTSAPVIVPPIMTALPHLMGSAGMLGGFYYAFTKQSGFWGYVGWSLLGSISGSILGGIIKGAAYPSAALEKKMGATGSKVCWEHTGKGSHQVPCKGGSGGE